MYYIFRSRCIITCLLTFLIITEEDWEEHHEKLAEEIKSYVGNGDTQDKTHVIIYNYNSVSVDVNICILKN